MEKLWKYIICSSAFVLAAMVLAAAYTSSSRSEGTISVTGLGETQFASDMIVVEGEFSVKNDAAADGYIELENQRKRVLSHLVSNGVSEESISFNMPTAREVFESVYVDGKYIGETSNGFILRQSFIVESMDVDAVEAASRKLPSLMAEGIMVEVYEPMYYFTKLESVKHDLIGAAAADARARAELMATNAGSSLGKLISSRAGVFQITAATGDEEFSAGGSFNLSSRVKKARVTVRAEFKVKNN